MSNNFSVRIGDNNIYLSTQIHQTFFLNLETVILLKEVESIVIMPIQGSLYGGLMLKIINSKGDRVINAHDFFEHNQFSHLNGEYSVSWDKDKMGLLIHC